jgi:hypothetical protein
MPTLNTLLSKLNCSSSKPKHEWQELASTNENDELGDLRSRGQEVLRELLKQEPGKPLMPVDKRSGNKIDWQAVLAKVNELQKEEEALQQKNHAKIGRLKKLKQAMERRMQDNKGSFSANLKTYPDRRNLSSSFMRSHSGAAPIARRVDSGGQIFCSHFADDRSKCSTSTKSAVTMHAIDEELEYM